MLSLLFIFVLILSVAVIIITSIIYSIIAIITANAIIRENYNPNYLKEGDFYRMMA